MDLFSIFEKFPDLFVAMSLREDGNMKLMDTGQDILKDCQVLKNRQIFLDKLGIPERDVVGVMPVHGNNTAIVTKKDSSTFIPTADGLITVYKNVFLSITVADCLPVILYDPEKDVLALLHCGWKGLWHNIIAEAIKKMKENFTVCPEELLAGIGPGIGACHFEVREDLIDKFGSFPEATITRGNHNFLDLKQIAKKQMENEGLKYGNIEVSPVCTFCESKKYFSHRKDRTEPVHAMIFVTGIF
jgi:polyphenol oxidase